MIWLFVTLREGVESQTRVMNSWVCNYTRLEQLHYLTFGFKLSNLSTLTVNLWPTFAKRNKRKSTVGNAPNSSAGGNAL